MSGDTAMANNTTSAPSPNVDPAIFKSLQKKIDEESAIKDELKNFVETLSKQGRVAQSILSRIYNTPTADLQSTVLTPCAEQLNEQAATVKSLAEAASKYPFYKFNQMWRNEIQSVVSNIQMCDWLKSGNLITLEEVGQRLNGTRNSCKMLHTS